MATGIQPTPQPVSIPVGTPPVPKRVRLIELALVVICTTYMPYLGTIYFLTQGSIQHHGPEWYRAAQMLGYELTAIAMVSYILFRRGGRPASIGFSLRWSDLWSGLGVWVGAVVISFLWGFIYYRLYHLSAGTYPVQKDLSALFDMRLNLLWALLMIVNGFFEEGIVRGFVTSDLTALTGNRWAAAATSVLLQIGYHGYQGITNMVLILPVFVFFAIYYAKTGRLTPLIVGHSIQDLALFGLHHR